MTCSSRPTPHKLKLIPSLRPLTAKVTLRHPNHKHNSHSTSLSRTSVYAVDAKINFDDNASFRQKDIFEQGDSSEEDPREVAANKVGLNYVGMDGNIGCMGKLFFFFFYLFHMCA